MQKDERDLLDVLKFELEFFEKGGYGRSPRQPWRFQHIFEDSPACMNYDSKDAPGPCSDCVLMQLVPPQFREHALPCRHIPLNAEGETLDSLYRYADQHELDEIYGKWLRSTIAKLEQTRRESGESATPPAMPGVTEAAGEPLYQKLHPKCANPACATIFHWFNGGTFFRFRQRSPHVTAEHAAAHETPGTEVTKHYWLCERCSHLFTLVSDENQSVVLKLRWPELPGATPPKQLPAR